ncbi:MAG: DrmE family protein [Shewanella xiamenensis]|nr:DrmE family protein [Shewanella xiamenensis]
MLEIAKDVDVKLTGWVRAVSDGWGAVSASDLLDPRCSMWNVLKLSPPSPGECISYAAIERALKYGQSVAVTLPVTENSLARLVVYLHRLRFDALQGGIRAPWLNAANCLNRKDVVCVTRPGAAIKAMSSVPDASAYVIKPHAGPSDSVVKRNVKGRTALINGELNVMELSEALSTKTHPIAFIVDGTRGGYEHIDQLDAALFESFPDIPRIVLLSLGDGQSIQKIRANRGDTHVWVTRLEDVRAVFKSDALPRLHLDVMTDETLSGHLQTLGKQLFDLRNTNKQIKDPVLKDKLSAVNKVWRSFGELAQPLTSLENVLLQRTRSGLFPVRTLARWLDIAEKGTCQYGEQTHQVNAVIENLRKLHNMLMNGMSGKAGFLLAKATQAIKSGRPIIVLVGSAHEADSMEQWLDKTLALPWRGDGLAALPVTVYSMDGLRSFRESKAVVDDVFIVGAPWDNRLHWLTTRCSALHFLCYAHEQQWYEKTLQQWWLNCAAQSPVDGDKARFWSLGWKPKIVDQPSSTLDGLNLEINSHTFLGQYAADKKIVEFPIDVNLDNWLEILLADAAEVRATADHTDLHDDFALIYTDKSQSALPWAIHRNLMVLGHDKISTKQPDELEPGEQILLLKHSTERIATQEALFDLLLESNGMREMLRMANKWNDLIDDVNAKTKGKTAEIRKLLAKEGVEVGEEAIKNWIAHRVIGPQSTDAVIQAFAKFVKMDSAEKQAQVISNAIKKIRSTHQQLGLELRKALIETAASKGQALKVGSYVIERELLNDMIDVQTVLSVQLPSAGSKKIEPKIESLQSIVESALASKDNKLLFTNAAMKSLRDSGFADLAIFKSCLDLMNSQLFEFYSSKSSRMFEVLEHFAKYEIEFQPKMSAVTMGKYGEQRLYKNKPADLGKHFKLGSGRDPKHTMRIHFDWDEEDQLIVIHHAGRHLETSQS